MCERSEDTAGPAAAPPTPTGGVPRGGENQPRQCHSQGLGEGPGQD